MFLTGISTLLTTYRRRVVQTVSLLALHSSWGPEFKWFCNPVLSCHSCVLSWFACPIGVFVHYAGYRVFPFMAVGMVLVAGILLGRLLCGWVCPFGFLQDLLYKIPSRKFALPRWTRWIKYVLLAVTVALIPYFRGELTMWSFCRGCPAATLQAAIPAAIASRTSVVDANFMLRLAILAAILILVIVTRRGFCRVICPIGALLAPLNYIAGRKVRVPTHYCISCGACDRTCPTECAPMPRIEQERLPSDDGECVLCHDCQPVCPVRRREQQSAARQEDR